MLKSASKIELLYIINELKERGDFEQAVRLQKIFLESIFEDRVSGKYSEEIDIDRRSKKAISGAKVSLLKSG